MELLLAHGAALDDRNGEGETPLRFAAEIVDTENLEFLTAKGSDINTVDNKGITPLMAAASLGLTETIKFLVKHGAHLHRPDEGGGDETALTLAAGIDVLRLLFELSETKFSRRVSPALSLSSSGASSSASEGEAGGEANKEAGEDGGKPLSFFEEHRGNLALMDCCQMREFESVEFLLSQGGSVNYSDGGENPLLMAIYGTTLPSYNEKGTKGKGKKREERERKKESGREKKKVRKLTTSLLRWQFAARSIFNRKGSVGAGGR